MSGADRDRPIVSDSKLLVIVLRGHMVPEAYREEISINCKKYIDRCYFVGQSNLVIE